MKTATRLLIVLLVAYCGTAAAEVYRWVDAQGRVHYSDRPDSEKAEVVGVVSHRTDASAVAQRAQSEQAQRQQIAAGDQQQQADQSTKNAVSKDLAATRAEQCKKAQDEYKTAIESRRLYRMGKNGEREYLTDAELTEARINAKKAVDSTCGKSAS